MSTASSTCCRPVTASVPPAAALKIACDLVDEGMIDREAGCCDDRAAVLWTLCCTRSLTQKALKAAHASRQGSGRFARSCLRSGSSSPLRTPRNGRPSGEKVVLVRLETSPEDIEGMKAAQGILTVRGGMTSHAAVVARGMGTCCVSGCSAHQDGRGEQEVRAGGQDLPRGRL